MTRKLSVTLYSFVAVAAFWVQAYARTILVPAQPVSPYADTEVSTNVVIQTGRTDVRDVKIRLQLDGTPTNNLEIAFGCDANTNGVLDVSEIETVYGWRAGRYFVENVRAWKRIETEAAVNALWNPPVAEGDQVGRMSEANEPRSGRKSPGVLDVHVEHGPDFAPRRFTATCGGETAFAGLSTTPPPAWLFRREWNMARVVRRGAGTPSEWVRCDVRHNSFAIKVR